jgi:hypothetical protein
MYSLINCLKMQTPSLGFKAVAITNHGWPEPYILASVFAVAFRSVYSSDGPLIAFAL